jgi:hypothetical protein
LCVWVSYRSNRSTLQEESDWFTCSIRASSTCCHWYEFILQRLLYETCCFYGENYCTDYEEWGTSIFFKHVFTPGRIIIEYSDYMIRGTILGAVAFLLYYYILKGHKFWM